MNPTTILSAVTHLTGGILGGLSDNTLEAAENIYKGGIGLFIKLSTFSDILNSSYGILPTYERNTAGDWILKEGVVGPIIDAGQTFGAALALIFMVVAMVDIYTQEKMSIETFAKPFLQYLITIALMLNMKKIVALFWNFGVLFEKEMLKLGDPEKLAEAIPIEFSRDASLGAIIGCFIGGIIMLLICFLLGLVVRVCAYIANFSRIIEAGVRAAGLPIALGIATDSSFRQGALRYIKKFFAVSLQGGIFAIISLLYVATSAKVITEAATKMSETSGAAISASAEFASETGQALPDPVKPVIMEIGAGVGGVLFTVVSTIIPLIGLALACIMLMFKSGQICNDIVGV